MELTEKSRLCCLSDFDQISVYGCKINFYIGKWQVFLSNNWVWYLEKRPNLKKWLEIKKTQPLQLIAAKLASAGTKPFWLEYA